MNVQLETPHITREQVLEIAEHASEILKTRFGATRVIVFGSARGDAPWHEDSDLDLAVEGLTKENFWDAFGAVQTLMPSELGFDLVEIERVPPQLAKRILGEIEVPQDPILALKSIIQDKLASLERIVMETEEEYSEIESFPTRRDMRLMASYAHDFYQASESIFERVAVYLDGGVPKGGDWHIQLLVEMYQDVPGTRPALISDDELYERLADYLKFRHVVRMAYNIEYDWDKLEPKIILMPDTLARLRAQLDAFFIALEQMKNNG